MKSFLLTISCICALGNVHAQHKTNPKAKALNDSAANIYRQAAGDRAKLQKVITILNAAIKADSLYYEAWTNKIALHGQLDQFEDEYKSLKKMQRLFPSKEEVQLQTGVLEYKTGRTADAMATFNKLLNHYNGLLEKNKNNANTRGLLYNKGIVLILANKVQEGKAVLTKLYDEEKDPYAKSGIAFYINSSREEIINDKIPGK